jgi:hypothetical protein
MTPSVNAEKIVLTFLHVRITVVFDYIGYHLNLQEREVLGHKRKRGVRFQAPQPKNTQCVK